MAGLKFSHGGNIYRYKKGVLDFSANINPLGLSQATKKILTKNLNAITHYPDPETLNARNAIAKSWGINKDNILLGNGSTELICLVFQAFRPKTTIIPVPAYSEYERAARTVNSKTIFPKLNENDGFKLNNNEQIKGDIFCLCNPNNPTGNLIDIKKGTVPVRGQSPFFRNRLTLIDEAFMDFVPERKKYTFIKEAVQGRKIAVLRSFTKFFAIPGLRLGCIIAHKDIIKKLEVYKMPWSVNALAQVLASSLVRDASYIKDSISLVTKERGFLIKGLSTIDGIKIYPSVTNFILLKLTKPHLTSDILEKRLVKEDILIRNCSNFRGLNDRFVRIAVRNRNENTRLIKILKKCY